MLDLLIDFSTTANAGSKQARRRAGNRCLVGALRDIRDGHNLHGTPTRRLSAECDAAISEGRMTGLISSTTGAGIRRTARVILQARS